ncbi:hypothetical protein D3C87_2076620 [compost metagenome]
MNLYQRIISPTPKIFRSLRSIGLLLLAISGGIVSAPATVPAFLTVSAGYLAVAGSVLAAVSQITIDTPSNVKKNAKKQDDGR